MLPMLLTLPVSLVASSAEPLTLEQVMADPDWIGSAVESPYWSLDGRQVLYSVKRQGSPLRDLHAIALDQGTVRAVSDNEVAVLDGPSPVFDRTRSRALFVRNGDVFLRDLRNSALLQLTRTGTVVGGPQFSADGAKAQFRIGQDWYSVDLNSRLMAQVAVVKAEKDPAAEPRPDALRDLQLELFSTLSRQKSDKEAQRERDLELRRADATRAPLPVFLGDDVIVTATALSPDGRWLLAMTQDKKQERGQGGKMPLYVTESGYEEVEDVRTRVGRNPPGGHKLVRVDLESLTQSVVPFDVLPGIGIDPLADLRKAAGKDALVGARPVRVDAVRFTDDGTRAAVMLRATDNKDRWIATLSAGKAELTPMHRLTDPGWINWNFNDFGWLPDHRTLWLLSEDSGYSHLYTVAQNGKAKMLTKGDWEVSDPQLSVDGSRFYFLCNRAWPGDYEVCVKEIGKGEVRELTALDGVEGFELSPDGRQLLVRYSRSYLPTQLALVPADGGEARVLTDTRSEAFKAIDWMAPRIAEVPSSQVKQPLWSKFYRPETLEPGRKYPIVLFVHGAGYTQNTHARYPYYFREQMFHNLLVQQGYLVLDIDFRASEGYGRDWRTAIYRHMGEPELQDLVDGVRWLVEHHQGDAANVGLYGGSYGGFMTLMAMFKAPEVFHAGAALRPVTDWTQYNHGYTANILNTPDIDPEAYRRSSPIFFADGLRGDLLIAHGMMDDNVFYQDSVRLAQRLIELEKENWELASYPLERHGYVHANAWLDQYRRIFKLFERRLK
ncbi:prolyl oligopeptidase family serine peptidase [Xanthomonadaceae bacterium XH05]|nr:prolyl oligopeptidase family serine peptidase [Xanthomonadaceae bacterium XH05]